MLQLTNEEKSYYKKMLSNTSKLKRKSISLDAIKLQNWIKTSQENPLQFLSVHVMH